MNRKRVAVFAKKVRSLAPRSVDHTRGRDVRGGGEIVVTKTTDKSTSTLYQQ